MSEHEKKNDGTSAPKKYDPPAITEEKTFETTVLTCTNVPASQGGNCGIFGVAQTST